MGSPWNERRTESDEPSMHGPGTPQTKPGLGAAELDLLRHAPDYDAEEMATVRPSGGWPASVPLSPAAAVSPAAVAEQPARPSWLPPNRIEPPPRVSAPVEVVPRGAAPGESAAAAAGAARLRFPEERTVALLAEDLLGRSLDEPDEPPARLGATPAAGCRAPAGESAGYSRHAGASMGGADFWDAAMPLVAEG
jgi:hypothetical protein